MRTVIALMLASVAMTASAQPAPFAIDIKRIAAQPKAVVDKILGEPIRCERIKQGPKCHYALGKTDVVYIFGLADWIAINDMGDAFYDRKVPTLLGLPQAKPDTSTDYVMRWAKYSGIREVSVFPSGARVDYVYIKTRTP